MRRREFIKVIGSAAAAWPLTAQAQQAMPVLGFLSSRSPSESEPLVAAFRKGLRQMEFVEGQNLKIAFRWAEGHYERLPTLAMELVDLHVTALFAAGGTASALAAKAATAVIPIIFVAGDPVRLGLVASLSRPGGNVTGISNLSAQLGAKSVDILKQMLPAVNAIAYLVNPSNGTTREMSRDASRAANALGVRLHFLDAGTVGELNEAFAKMAKLHIGALGVMADAFFDTERERIVELSARYALAGCYPWREYVSSGGLMSYGTNLADSYRLAGIYAGRILHGERPADLPVMQSTKFELVLNLKTAKTLGITVPPTLLAFADDVIE